MLEKQRKEPGDAVVSTVLFDNETEVIHDRVAIADVPNLTDKEYFVRGCTALLDAVGGAIHHIGNVHKYARKEDVPEKTLFIITTDGMENVSRRYTYEKVRYMIERQKERYGWEFLFLGANIDSVRHAARLSAEVTHNHPEGIKGAEATAAAIFLARTGCSKAEIKEYIEHEFGYALNRTCDEIRPNYHHTETSRARCLTLREFETPMELHCSQTTVIIIYL